MTAIYEALKAEREQRTLTNEQELQREQKLIEFLSVADKFTDVCKLLTAGHPLIVAGTQVEVSEDASVVELATISTDVQGVQHVALGDFHCESVPPFETVLAAASHVVRGIAEGLGMVELEERLTL